MVCAGHPFSQLISRQRAISSHNSVEVRQIKRFFYSFNARARRRRANKVSQGVRVSAWLAAMRHYNLNVTIGLNSPDGLNEGGERSLNAWPAGGAEHNDGDVAIGQIMLVFEVLVSSNENLEALTFSLLQ